MKDKHKIARIKQGQYKGHLAKVITMDYMMGQCHIYPTDDSDPSKNKPMVNEHCKYERNLIPCDEGCIC